MDPPAHPPSCPRRRSREPPLKSRSNCRKLARSPLPTRNCPGAPFPAHLYLYVHAAAKGAPRRPQYHHLRAVPQQQGREYSVESQGSSTPGPCGQTLGKAKAQLTTARQRFLFGAAGATRSTRSGPAGGGSRPQQLRGSSPLPAPPTVTLVSNKPADRRLGMVPSLAGPALEIWGPLALCARPPASCPQPAGCLGCSVVLPWPRAPPPLPPRRKHA